MIEDFDGPDPTPRHRIHMRVISVALVAAALVGYAAASSPDFEGPFATPRPFTSQALRYTPEPVPILIEPPVAGFAPAYGNRCVMPGATTTQVIFLGGQTVTQTRPLTELVPTCPPGPRPRFER